ncbi:hypothetical protein AB0F91_19745 [Amycolatopsis sp. NPDC023774]|uniref:hypothetical protein n=1 Tax=Amycolatopsis sp. NPDC023774 TaxID=3155015 RepID=UPI0033C3D877
MIRAARETSSSTSPSTATEPVRLSVATRAITTAERSASGAAATSTSAAHLAQPPFGHAQRGGRRGDHVRRRPPGLEIRRPHRERVLLGRSPCIQPPPAPSPVRAGNAAA